MESSELPNTLIAMVGAVVASLAPGAAGRSRALSDLVKAARGASPASREPLATSRPHFPLAVTAAAPAPCFPSSALAAAVLVALLIPAGERV